MMKRSPWQEEVLAAGELYAVGGAVRDALMGRAPGEEDFLVRGLTPGRLMAILGKHGKVALVGKSFGVFKFRPAAGGHAVDVAFPRRELSTGPGHRDFDVAFDPSLPVEADLGRRDFTMNAVARNLADGSLVDPHGGRRDIERRVVRMIFGAAFAEDALRILRGIRLAARLGFDIEKKTLAAMARDSALLQTLSAERVQEELNKLLSECDRPSVGLERMYETGALAIVLPELARAHGVEQNEYHPDDVFHHSVKSCDNAPRDNLLVRWAALLHDVGKVDKKQVITEEGAEPRVVFYGHEKTSAEMTGAVLARLRFAGDFRRRCVHLVAEHMFYYQPEWKRSTLRRFIRTVGPENLDDLFLLRRADLLSRELGGELPGLDDLRRRIQQELDAEHAFKVSDLAVDGQDVMRVLGLGEGERVGTILEALFERVLDEPRLNQRETLLAMMEKDFGGK